MSPRSLCATLILAAVVLASATSCAGAARVAAGGDPLARGGAGHTGGPPDASAQGCESCHAQATPAVVAAWEGGAHGLNLVRCFVCHGSRGDDFTRSAAAQRCDGCHGDAVASVTAPGGKTQSCFECHAPHTLAAQGRPNPHAPVAAQ
jgi:hypothetical protein